MLIGNKSIDTRALKRACSSPQALLEFTERLVPEQCRHVRAIVDNQKYYVSTLVRAFKSIPYVRKVQLCNHLLRGVTVCGVCNELFDYGDLLASIDIGMWEKLEELNDDT